MVDQNVIDEIMRFKAALERREDASDSEESIGASTSNRGRKLKRKARTVHEGRLGMAYGAGLQTEAVEYANKRRQVIRLLSTHKRAADSDSDEEYGDDEDEEVDEDDDPYAGIDLEAILSPIGHPSELPGHPGLSKAYTRTTISTLARRALDLICTEQKQVSQLNRLLAAFLGDNPTYIRDGNLHLPELYDHDGEGDKPPTSDTSADKAAGEDGSTKLNGYSSKSESAIKAEDTENGINGNGLPVDGQEEGSDADDAGHAQTRRITRNQTTNEIEPFFALPRLEIDRDFGFPPDVAQETRQLAQIAAQRGEEFIRSLYKIRAGLLRADRCRAQVYKWCREVGGDMSEDEESPQQT
ncbi:RXT2-like protein [Myxozyma melibiosi]|uniref:RXT2-like protein n=1 Tax=Myxozyma melibiosi TaxID=54550 RepID=A0ABR1F789_9ASCO